MPFAAVALLLGLCDDAKPRMRPNAVYPTESFIDDNCLLRDVRLRRLLGGLCSSLSFGLRIVLTFPTGFVRLWLASGQLRERANAVPPWRFLAGETGRGDLTAQARRYRLLLLLGVCGGALVLRGQIATRNVR